MPIIPFLRWPQKESKKQSTLYWEKEQKYRQLSDELYREAVTLIKEQNSLQEDQNALVNEERKGLFDLEGILDDRYQEAVTRNDGIWDQLFDHYGEGIKKILKGSTDASDLATKYKVMAMVAENEEKQEAKERP